MGNKSGKETRADQPTEGAQSPVDAHVSQAPSAPQAQTPDVKKVEDKAKDAARQAEAKAKETAQTAETKVKDAARAAETKAKDAARAAETKAKDAVRAVDTKAKEVAPAAEAKAKELARAAEAKAKEVVDKAKDAAKDVKQAAQGSSVGQQVVDKSEHGIQAVKHAIDSIRVHEEGLGKETAKVINKAENVTKDFSQYVKQARNASMTFYGLASSQLADLNREGPLAIANFKRQYIFPVDPIARKVAFYGITGLTLLVSVKTGRGVFRALRNTAFVGLTTGFFVSPESINPFLQSPPSDEDEHQD